MIFAAPASASYNLGITKWRLNSSQYYDHVVIVCHWQRYPLPGGYGGAYWEAMHRAVDRWNSIGGELHFSLSATPCGSSIPEPYVAVGYKAADAGSIAYTDVFIGPCLEGPGNRCVNHADVTLNPNKDWGDLGILGTYDRESAYMHEFGHTLMLEHSLSCTCEIMYPSLASGQIRRLLSQDDINGYAYWYGTTH